MKKNYFFTMLFAFVMMGVYAQNIEFEDNMESYIAGSPVYGDHWTDWGCGGSCSVLASDTYSRSGDISGYVDDGGTIDGVLDMGNKIFGTWGLRFYMYIPAGKGGYFNLQGQVPIGAGEWAVGNIYFFEPEAGSAGVGSVDLGITDTTLWLDFTYPEDEWFEVIINVDISTGISASTWQFFVDGVEATDGFEPFASYDATGVQTEYPSALGGIDFFSIDSNNTYYLDDFIYQDEFFTPSGSSVEDLEAKGFSAYPNPVNDVLNLRADEAMTSVTIHNLLGQKVYQADINAIQTTVDMSGFTNGTYFVTVNIAGSEGTVKVMK